MNALIATGSQQGFIKLVLELDNMIVKWISEENKIGKHAADVKVY